MIKITLDLTTRWVKKIQIQSFVWSVFYCIQSEHRKIRTRKKSVFGHFSRNGNINTIRSIFLRKQHHHFPSKKECAMETFSKLNFKRVAIFKYWHKISNLKNKILRTHTSVKFFYVALTQSKLPCLKVAMESPEYCVKSVEN